jgi:hypothetical protein
MTKDYIWTEAECDFIRLAAPVYKDAELALVLSKISGRYISLKALRHKRVELNIHKREGQGICRIRPEGAPRKLSKDNPSI